MPSFCHPQLLLLPIPAFVTTARDKAGRGSLGMRHLCVHPSTSSWPLHRMNLPRTYNYCKWHHKMKVSWQVFLAITWLKGLRARNSGLLSMVLLITFKMCQAVEIVVHVYSWQLWRRKEDHLSCGDFMEWNVWNTEQLCRSSLQSELFCVFPSVLFHSMKLLPLFISGCNRLVEKLSCWSIVVQFSWNTRTTHVY